MESSAYRALVNQVDLEKAVLEIQERNSRVEADKAWELSWTRKIAVTSLTYIVAAIFLLVAQSPLPYFGALIPSAGFLLSTLSMPWFKKQWIERHTKKSKV